MNAQPSQGSKYLYGLSVYSIQSYIFDTNALKEIIGASEIVESICTKFLPYILGDRFVEENLILSAAGNIRYLFDSEENAKDVFEKMPNKIRAAAGKVKFSQAIVEYKEKGNSYNELNNKLLSLKNQPLGYNDMLAMGKYRERRTGESLYKKKGSGNGTSYYDLTTCQKLKYNKDSNLLLEKLAFTDEWSFPKDISQIVDASSKNYVAIVHADGNSLGTTIKSYVKEQDFSSLKKLSDAIEKSTIAAFQKAFKEVIEQTDNFKTDENLPKKIPPIRPVILGGDDVTFIIRADLALPFTMAYLQSFEEQTKANFKDFKGVDKLTATAGITFIKEKYPFHYGVHLAESITQYAKNKTDRQYSSLQFYKVKDAFVSDFKDIIPVEYNAKDKVIFNHSPLSIEEGKKLLQNVKKLKSSDISIGALRQLLSTLYENKSKADFQFNRIKSLQSNSLILSEIGIDENYEDLHNLITIESLTPNKKQTTRW